LGEVAVMVISLAGIICDSENKMLILTMYLKKYLNSNTNILQKYLNNYQIQMYLTPCLIYYTLKLDNVLNITPWILNVVVVMYLVMCF